MRGRKTDPTKIKMGQTRAAKPKKTNAKVMRKALAEAAAKPDGPVADLLATVEANRPKRRLTTKDTHPPFGRVDSSNPSVFLLALDLSPHITPAQRLVIERIGRMQFVNRWWLVERKPIGGQDRRAIWLEQFCNPPPVPPQPNDPNRCTVQVTRRPPDVLPQCFGFVKRRQAPAEGSDDRKRVLCHLIG